jgi:hypothetical protein
MDFIESTFFELRLSILEDLLLTNPSFKRSYTNAFEDLKNQTLSAKPTEWERLLVLIEERLEHIKTLD